MPFTAIGNSQIFTRHRRFRYGSRSIFLGRGFGFGRFVTGALSYLAVTGGGTFGSINCSVGGPSSGTIATGVTRLRFWCFAGFLVDWIALTVTDAVGGLLSDWFADLVITLIAESDRFRLFDTIRDRSVTVDTSIG